MNSKAHLVLLAVAVMVALATPSQAVEFVSNGDFEGFMSNPQLSDPVGSGGAGFDVLADSIPQGWYLTETFYGNQSESSQATNNTFTNGPAQPGVQCMSFTRSGGGGSGDWTAINQQNLNIDIGSYTQLTLSIDVLLDPPAHNLEAGGWSPTPAFEWPAVVELEFDAAAPYDTMAHTYGGAGNPWIWRHGFYLNAPDGPGDVVQGQVNDPGDQPLITSFHDTAVAPSLWGTYTFDLLAELPQAETISRIRVGGSGWDYGSLIDNVSIVGIPEPATLSLLALGGLAMIRRRRR